MVTEVAPEHTENKEGGCCTLMSMSLKREEMGEGCGGCMTIKIKKWIIPQHAGAHQRRVNLIRWGGSSIFGFPLERDATWSYDSGWETIGERFSELVEEAARSERTTWSVSPTAYYFTSTPEVIFTLSLIFHFLSGPSTCLPRVIGHGWPDH